MHSTTGVKAKKKKKWFSGRVLTAVMGLNSCHSPNVVYPATAFGARTGSRSRHIRPFVRVRNGWPLPCSGDISLRGYWSASRARNGRPHSQRVNVWFEIQRSRKATVHRQVFGQCGRWGSGPAMTASGRLADGDGEILLNVCFVIARPQQRDHCCRSSSQSLTSGTQSTAVVEGLLTGSRRPERPLGIKPDSDRNELVTGRGPAKLAERQLLYCAASKNQHIYDGRS